MSAKQKNIDENNYKEENGQAKEVDYDEFLSSAGEIGKYQVFLFFATFPFYVFGAFSYFSQVFLTETTPNHWCLIPDLQNLSITERRSLAIPLDKDSPFGYSRCEQYDANWTAVISTGINSNATWNKVPCQNGWEFNSTEFAYPTIGMEMGWVCEKDSNQATAQSFFFVGSIAGGFLIGWVADRFGRIPAAVCSNMIGAIAGTASIFVNNFVEFTICRFFMGMSYDNCMMMTYLLVLEYSAPKYRTRITNLSFAAFFTTGAVVLPWISLACGYWKTVALATSLPMALSLLAPFIIPESPRWLLSKGRIDDAVEKVLNIARVNKKVIPKSLIDNFKQTTLNSPKATNNVLDLLKRPLLRRVFICVCLEYTFCMLIFDALIRTIGQLQFDFYVSFSVISLTEFPSLVILSFVLDYTGRKPMMIITLTVCAIFSFLIPFVSGGLTSMLCAVVARFMVNMACNTVMQWAAEVLPTSVRGSGTSIAHICGYIATVISPFVAYLEVYKPWLPMVIVGSIGAAGALLSITLPETAKRDMPQTFENAEDLIRSQGFFDMFRIKKQPVDVNTHAHVNASFELN
uniref:Major facilitator superfamily (MFS) profile domain-containing protein n=1 Tax=Heliothis virescens TaxID=7102 RepID=A0A2A4JVU5_HELVI